MSRNIILLIIYTLIVFIQVFFLDNFEIKIGLIFIPLLILVARKETFSFYISSIVLFITYDFFKNNFVGISLLIFLIINFFIDQLAKLWGVDLILFVKFCVVFTIFYFFAGNLITINALINILILGTIFLVRRVVKDGYFRLN